MSDIKSEKQFQLLLESIDRKLNSAEVLNGGFDKMFVIIEGMKEKQKETSGKVDQIHHELYNHKDGLYARVAAVENGVKTSTDKLSETLTATSEKLSKEISSLNVSFEKLSRSDAEQSKHSDNLVKLKKIAGDDLEKLESVIKTKTSITDGWGKILWILAGGVFAAVGKMIFEIIFKRP